MPNSIRMKIANKRNMLIARRTSFHFIWESWMPLPKKIMDIWHLGEYVTSIALHRKKCIKSINFMYFLWFQLTWADIELVTIMDMCNCWLGFDATANYTHLATVRKNVMSVDTIKEWYEKRPKSEAY